MDVVGKGWRKEERKKALERKSWIGKYWMWIQEVGKGERLEVCGRESWGEVKGQGPRQKPQNKQGDRNRWYIGPSQGWECARETTRGSSRLAGSVVMGVKGSARN